MKKVASISDLCSDMSGHVGAFDYAHCWFMVSQETKPSENTLLFLKERKAESDFLEI